MRTQTYISRSILAHSEPVCVVTSLNLDLGNPLLRSKIVICRKDNISILLFYKKPAAGAVKCPIFIIGIYRYPILKPCMSLDAKIILTQADFRNTGMVLAYRQSY